MRDRAFARAAVCVYTKRTMFVPSEFREPEELESLKKNRGDRWEAGRRG